MREIFSLSCATGGCEVLGTLGMSACVQLTELGFGCRTNPEGGKRKIPLSPHNGRSCPGMTGPLQASPNANPVHFCPLPGELTKFFALQYRGVPTSMIRTAAEAITRNVVTPFDVPAPQGSIEENIYLWGGLIRRIDMLDYPDEHQRPANLESAIDRTQIIPISRGQQQ